MYDTNEASALWAASRKVDREERKKAAVALLDTVAELAKAAGFETSPDDSQPGPATNFWHRDTPGRLVWAGIDQTGTFFAGREEDPTTKQALDVVYDAGLGVYVGTEEDSYLVPKPGDLRIQRRPATAVLTSALLTLLGRRT